MGKKKIIVDIPYTGGTNLFILELKVMLVLAGCLGLLCLTM
jgi:hypothetical protein